MFDAHAHMQDSRLDGCREAVLAAARAAGIGGICTCGTSPADWPGVARLAAAHATPPLVLHPAFGVHPWFCGELPADWLAVLDRCLETHPRAAVGEIGIDGLRRDLDRNRQRDVFEAQLELAVRRQRTVVVHGARAWGTLADILTPYAARLPGIVLHAFASSEPLVQTFLGLGAYLSFVGSLCNPNATRVQAAAHAIPLDRLLVETDSPDILPTNGAPFMTPSGETALNHPANLSLVAQALAQVKGLDVETITEATTRNARRVYGVI